MDGEGERSQIAGVFINLEVLKADREEFVRKSMLLKGFKMQEKNQELITMQNKMNTKTNKYR